MEKRSIESYKKIKRRNMYCQVFLVVGIFAAIILNVYLFILVDHKRSYGEYVRKVLRSRQSQIEKAAEIKTIMRAQRRKEWLDKPENILIKLNIDNDFMDEPR